MFLPFARVSTSCPFSAPTARTLDRLSAVASSAPAPFAAVTRNCNPAGAPAEWLASQLKSCRPASCAPKSMLSSTWPPAVMISTCTPVAAWPRSKPPCPVLPAIDRAEPSVITLRPTRAAPCLSCQASNCAAMRCMVWLSCCMPVTVLICAICEVIWALSSGFIGSWLFNCATNNFRNRSWAADGSVTAWALAPGMARAAVGGEAGGGGWGGGGRGGRGGGQGRQRRLWRPGGPPCPAGPGWHWQSWRVFRGWRARLLAQLQRLEQQRLGRVHDLDVVLVRARGGNHVDHLLHGVHVGMRHIALRVGQGVAGVM